MPPTVASTTAQQLKEIKDELDEVARILRGSNGTPGLIAKVDALDTKIMSHVADERRCPALDVVDTMKGTLERPGLIEIVRNLVSWKSNVDRLTWLMITTIVVSGINIVVTLFADMILNK